MQRQDASKEPRLTRREMLEQWKQNRAKTEPPKGCKPVFVKPVKFEEMLRTPQKFSEKPKFPGSAREKQSTCKPPSTSSSVRKIYSQHDTTRINYKEKENIHPNRFGNTDIKPLTKNIMRPIKCPGVQSCVQKFSVPTSYHDKDLSQSVRYHGPPREIVNQITPNMKPKGIVSVDRTVGYLQFDKLSKDFMKSLKESPIIEKEVKGPIEAQSKDEIASIKENQSILQACLEELSCDFVSNENENIANTGPDPNPKCEEETTPLVNEIPSEELKRNSNESFQIQTINLREEIIEERHYNNLNLKPICAIENESVQLLEVETKKPLERLQAEDEELELIIQIIEDERPQEVQILKKKTLTATKRTYSERDRGAGPQTMLDQTDNLKKVILKCEKQENEFMTPSEKIKPEFLPVKQSVTSKSRLLIAPSSERIEDDNYGSLITYSALENKDDKVMKPVRRSKRVCGVVKNYSQTTPRKSVKKCTFLNEEADLLIEKPFKKNEKRPKRIPSDPEWLNEVYVEIIQ